MLVALRVPADNARGPVYMEQALAAIQRGNAERLPVTFGIAVVDGSLTLFCRHPCSLQSLIRSQLYAQFPDASIVPIPEFSLAPDACAWTTELTLHPYVFPIKRHTQFEDAQDRRIIDPISALLLAVRRENDHGIQTAIEVIIRPASRRIRLRAERCLRRLATPFFRRHPRTAHAYAAVALAPHWPLRLLARAALTLLPAAPADMHGLHSSTSRQHEREDDLQAASDKLGRLLFECRIRLTVAAPRRDANRGRDVLHEIIAAFGQFTAPRLATFHAARPRRSTRTPARFRSRPFLLSTEELATLFHPATQSVRAPTLAQVECRELPAPASLPVPSTHPGLALLGTTSFRGTTKQFGILPDDRRRHVAILGKTGMGKTTLLRYLLSSDIHAGRGVGLIDPHGDLAEAVLAGVPRARTNDVAVFDASDTEHPLSFNVLDCPTPALRPLVASGLVSAFKKLYGSSWGPRLEHILRNTLLALLEVPGTTLVSVLRMLGEPHYRNAVAARLTDPVVRAFWQREFPAMPTKLQAEAVAPILNKVGHFVSSPIVRNIVAQERNSLPLRKLLDDGRVLIVNLSKGRIGDDASALLGAFLVTGLQLAAMSRANVPEDRRRDFFLYVDEFQNFATDSFAGILSEARKYRLCLTVANQYLAQLDDATLHALFGNVGTVAAFQVGAKDAEIIAEQLGGDVTAKDLLRLPRYHAYVRLLIDGMPSLPFTMRTLPPPRPSQACARTAVIRRSSRHRYARPLAAAEDAVRRALAAA